MDFSNFVGGGFSTSTSSATTALQLAYMVLGIGNGDEVIVTSLTHIATANSIRAVGATPVFVDVDKLPELQNLTPIPLKKGALLNEFISHVSGESIGEHCYPTLGEVIQVTELCLGNSTL